MALKHISTYLNQIYEEVNYEEIKALKNFIKDYNSPERIDFDSVFNIDYFRPSINHGSDYSEVTDLDMDVKVDLDAFFNDVAEEFVNETYPTMDKEEAKEKIKEIQDYIDRNKKVLLSTIEGLEYKSSKEYEYQDRREISYTMDVDFSFKITAIEKLDSKTASVKINITDAS